MSQFSIRFWIALPDEGPLHFSTMQGFSPALLKRSQIYRQILWKLPPTALELYGPSIATLQQRLAGSAPYTILPLILSDFNKIAPTSDDPFWVVFTDSETSSTITRWVRRTAHPILVVNTDDARPSPDDPLLSRELLREHCDSVLDYLRKIDTDHLLFHMEEWRESRDPNDKVDIEITYYGHNTTIPNELALLSVGCHFAEQKSPLVGNDDAYIEAITNSADEVAKLRSIVPPTELYRAFPQMWDLILTSPGIYRHVRQFRRPKGMPANETYRMFRMVQSQQTYSFFAEPDELKRLLNDPGAQSVIAERTSELNAYTSAVATRAASYLSPVLRLPPAVDHVMPWVVRLGDSIRADGRRREKLPVKKLRQLSDELFTELAARIDSRFLDRIDKPHNHVKIISDAPLEWLPVRGLPLMLRHATSRIPTTPGNLSFAEILPKPQFGVPMRAFEETLIVRSFRSDDPLRNDLETAIAEYQKARDIPARFVDVRNKMDLVRAFDGFDGALAIFDCHGVHSSRDDIGKLQLADEEVDIWTIRNDVRIPPIVFTCACDTHALARSHATCGNGLLFCGATAVIASVLPVHAKKAAIFAARLLFRIYELLPKLTEELRTVVRWDFVVSLLQRMMFVTEFIHTIEARHVGPKNWALNASVRSVGIIHNSDGNWYEECVQVIADEAKAKPVDIEAIRCEFLPFPETLKYLHMGNPEVILICPENQGPEDIGLEALPSLRHHPRPF